MKEFTLKITKDNIDLINNFRKEFNEEKYKLPIEEGYFFVECKMLYNYSKFPQLFGRTGIGPYPEISTEEFIKFYNEKMNINQSIYELW